MSADNLYDQLQNSNLPMPDNLYLIQPAHELPGRYRFYMDVDAIRLIDTQQEEKN